MTTFITSNNAPIYSVAAGPTPSSNTTPTRQGANTYFQPVPVAVVLQGGSVGVAYSETVTCQGGTPPFSYSLFSGSLPAGLTLSSSGLISGTPTTSSTYSFFIAVTDANGFQGFQNFSIAIGTPSGGNYIIIA